MARAVSDIFSKATRFDRFSQNGEDGIIAALFEDLGPGRRRCCEFGAWDGIHFSNCRNLVLQGWECLFIEGDESRYRDLVKNYEGYEHVHAVHGLIDASVNKLEDVVRPIWPDGEIDFLSIDIDGLDYQLLRDLRVRPRVICIEVNAAHSPLSDVEFAPDVASRNHGQPLNIFVGAAGEHGYSLLGYNGNAFFIRDDECARLGWSKTSSIKAYERFLDYLEDKEKEWLYLVNKGLAPPFHSFANPYLGAKRLGIHPTRACGLVIGTKLAPYVNRGKYLATRLIQRATGKP
jgi:hypothetical protein